MKRLLLISLLCLFSCEEENTAKKNGKPEKFPSIATYLELELPQPTFDGTPENLPMKLKKPQRKKIVISPDISIISLGCKVDSSDSEPIVGELSYVTDGDKEGMNGCYVELGPNKQWLQIDLGSVKEIVAIALWHNFKTGRVYYDVVIQLSNDKDFITSETIFNNDRDNSSGLGVGGDDYYLEDYKGKLLDIGGLSYRYIRCWSNGSTSSDLNHYTEVEVWGK